MTVETILLGCCAGLLATVTMDLLGTVCRRIGVAAGAKGERVGIRSDGFLEARGYGLANGAFPWLLLFPALGFGWSGLRGAPELRRFRASLINHLSCGFGLWWTAVLLPFD